MTVTDSRLKQGKLTLAAVEFATQARNVRIVPQHEADGDAVELLSGDELPAPKKRTDVLAIVAVQDFDNPDGFVAWTWTHDLEKHTFTWKPSGDTGPTYSGVVEVRAVEVGGDVGTRLDTEAEWDVVGAVTVTAAPVAPAPPVAPLSDSDATDTSSS